MAPSPEAELGSRHAALARLRSAALGLAAGAAAFGFLSRSPSLRSTLPILTAVLAALTMAILLQSVP